MKYRKFSLLNLVEQFDDDDLEDDDLDNEEPDDFAPDILPDEPDYDDDEDLPNANVLARHDDAEDGRPPAQGEVKPQKAKPLSPVQRLKIKWKEENPGLTEGDMNGAIQSFNLRKNNLRPISDNPEIRNMPEVLALKQRFPNFPAQDVQKLKDITTYSWAQIEFFLDRFSEEEIIEDLNWNIIGDTPEERWRLSMEKWKKSYNKILDEDGLIVHVIHSKEEAVALGQLQQKLAGKFGGNAWCVTYAPGQNGDNLYDSYRSRRAFYYIMDTKRDERDNNYIAAIQVVDPNTTNYRHELPYCLTPRSNHAVGNGDSEVTGVDWDYMVARWPALRDKQHLFKWFGKTKQERKDIELNRIVFREGDQNDFAIQPVRVQRMFIESNRTIASPRAFLTLNTELQHSYVARTTLDDYKLRYKSDDTTKPFAMIDALSKPDLKFLDNVVLKTQLKIPDGINAIKANILKSNYKVSYSDIENSSVMMFSSKFDNSIFGVMDLKTLKWIKPIIYIQGKATTLVDRASRKLYILRRYTAEDGSDYYYWLFNQKDLTDKNSPTYLKGKFYEGRDGDELMNKYQKLG